MSSIEQASESEIKPIVVNNKYYTTEEVAEMLKVTTDSVGRWVRDGKLKSIKLSGKFIRISQEDLRAFIKNQKNHIR